MPYCRHKILHDTNEVEVISIKTGTTVVVPIDRLIGNMRWLADRTVDLLYRHSEIACSDMQNLLDDAEEIIPGPGIDARTIKRRTLEERAAAGDLRIAGGR